MFNNKGAATAPTSKEALLEQFEKDQKSISMKMQSVMMAMEKLKLALGRMSKELYGTENFSEKKSYWGHIFWFLALLLVAGVEIPLNAMSFEIFDRAQEETRVMAVVFGLLIATLAHFTGYGFKRAKAGEKSYSAVGWICLLIALIAFSTTASFRVQYMQLMGFQNSLGWFSQFAFALIIFAIGAMASYFHTSDVKNIKLEKIFKTELKRLKSLRKELEDLIRENDQLKNQYRKDFNAIEQRAIDQAKEEKISGQKKAKREAEIAEADKDEVTTKNTEFQNLYAKFHVLLEEAKGMIAGYENDTNELKTHVPYMQTRAGLKILLIEAENVSTNENTDKLAEMNNEFNNLIA